MECGFCCYYITRQDVVLCDDTTAVFQNYSIHQWARNHTQHSSKYSQIKGEVRKIGKFKIVYLVTEFLFNAHKKKKKDPVPKLVVKGLIS